MPPNLENKNVATIEANELLSYESLKTKHRAERESFDEALALRTHRALSWLNRAEQSGDDADARFIFLWIALNAAYAREILDRRTFTERRLLVEYLHRLIQLDDERLVYNAVWSSYSQSIRHFLDNRYVFQPYWDYEAGRISEGSWRESFRKSKIAISKSLGKMNTKKVLAILFDRLYTLRNQLVHGGSACNSGVNRDQVRKGPRILGLLVPLMIYLMMHELRERWGDPCYPVITR